MPKDGKINLHWAGRKQLVNQNFILGQSIFQKNKDKIKTYSKKKTWKNLSLKKILDTLEEEEKLSQMEERNVKWNDKKKYW